MCNSDKMCRGFHYYISGTRLMFSCVFSLRVLATVVFYVKLAYFVSR